MKVSELLQNIVLADDEINLLLDIKKNLARRHYFLNDEDDILFFAHAILRFSRKKSFSVNYQNNTFPSYVFDNMISANKTLSSIQSKQNESIVYVKINHGFWQNYFKILCILSGLSAFDDAFMVSYFKKDEVFWKQVFL